MMSQGVERSRKAAINDSLLYRRAFSAALTGLAIQLGLSLAAGLTALWADAPAFYAAGWHMLGGLPIWIGLALIYQQHEAERKQRMAAEKIASSGRDSAAIFGNLSDDLDAARGRLDRLYRYGLPIVSGVVSLYLVVAGVTLLSLRHSASQTPGPANAPGGQGLGGDAVSLMFVTAAIAFTAFVTARWISGYARQRSWQLLRGGASYLMSCFVVGLLVFAGAAGVSIADNTSFLGWVAVAIPAFMILVGVEILITSLLESYRPKVPGGIPRPAFDSRVLGLLTSPESLGRVVAETISYQFGVEVSRSWLYQLLGTALTPLTLLAAAVLVGLSCLAVVGTEQRGILLRCGAMVGDPLAPGLHLKAPWPYETVELHPVGKVHEIVISTDLSGVLRNTDAILWTTAGDRAASLAQEDFLTAPGGRSDSGVSLISADVIVQYSVRSLPDFVLGPVDHDNLLRMVAEREVSQYFASHDIDDLLGPGRSRAGAELHPRIQARFDDMQLGVDVVAAAVTALHPPLGEVGRAFHQQIGAVQMRETAIQNAKKEAVQQLVRVTGSVDLSLRIDAAIRRLDALRIAGESASAATVEQEIDGLLSSVKGEAAELVDTARSYRWQRVVNEGASSDRFTGELLAYEASPRYYRTRRFLDVLAGGLTGRRKFVLAGDAGDAPVFRMDFSDPTSAIDTLLSK